MKGRPQDAKNRFYRKLKVDKEIREIISWFNKAKQGILKRLKE